MKSASIFAVVIFLAGTPILAQAENSIECSNGAFTSVSIARNSQGSFAGGANFNYQNAKIIQCEDLEGGVTCTGYWTPKNEPLKFTAYYLGNGVIDASLKLPQTIGGGKTVKIPCIAN